MTQVFRTVDLSPGLYVVATPIGNLRDISLRALDTLASVDIIFAEDTRQTKRLLDAYGIDAQLKPYHDHNGAQMRPMVLKAVDDGKAVALVSDAGTPLISDPGYKLVREIGDAGGDVVPIPGPSAAITALSAAGLPTDMFTFAGFLPPKSGQRQEKLRDFAGQKLTLIFYETGPRLLAALEDVVSVFGPETEIAVARELTKMFEEITRETASDTVARLTASGPPKGEIVLMISLTGEEVSSASEADVDQYILDRLKPLGAKGAASEAARQFKLPKRELYARAVALQNRDSNG